MNKFKFKSGDYLCTSNHRSIYRVNRRDKNSGNVILRDVISNEDKVLYPEHYAFFSRASVLDYLRVLDAEEFYNAVYVSGLDGYACIVCKYKNVPCSDKSCKVAGIASLKEPMTDKLLARLKGKSTY